MLVSISDILDRYSISILKKQRANAENDEELQTLSQEIYEYRKKEPVLIDEYLNKLIEVNGNIWDLESDIRKGKEGELGLEEVGRRAIKIRELNKIRVGYKNQIVDIFQEGYKDIKVNHASENE